MSEEPTREIGNIQSVQFHRLSPKCAVIYHVPVKAWKHTVVPVYSDNQGVLKVVKLASEVQVQGTA